MDALHPRGSTPRLRATRNDGRFFSAIPSRDAGRRSLEAGREAATHRVLADRARLDEALAVANSTAYKLTGGIFSRKPAHLERAKREYRVGNLYLNRGITGALVGRQPFGGFGMSGLGSKAGGAGYLEHFVVPRAMCENTMRRGFAPGLE